MARDLVQSLNRGRITQVLTSGVYVEVPELGIGMEVGPVESLMPPETVYLPGDKVLLGSVSGVYDDVIIMGRLVLPQAGG